MEQEKPPAESGVAIAESGVAIMCLPLLVTFPKGINLVSVGYVFTDGTDGAKRV